MPGTDILKKLVLILSGSNGSLSDLIGWGFQFALTLGVLVWLGHWLDKQYDSNPLFVLLGIFMGLFGGFYRLYRIITSLSSKPNKKDDRL